MCRAIFQRSLSRYLTNTKTFHESKANAIIANTCQEPSISKTVQCEVAQGGFANIFIIGLCRRAVCTMLGYRYLNANIRELQNSKICNLPSHVVTSQDVRSYTAFINSKCKQQMHQMASGHFLSPTSVTLTQFWPRYLHRCATNI